MSIGIAELRCPGCGLTFECGIEGIEPCWCSAEFPAVLPLPEAARGCYCRQCLARLICADPRAPEWKPPD